jgi:cellobiose-specific phosphotransferase system component IIC
MDMKKAAEEKAKQQKEPSKAEGKKEQAKQAGSLRTGLMIAVPIVLAFAVFFIVILPVLSVPFSTFKSNFQSAARIAIIASYGNQTGSGVTLQCAALVAYSVALSRSANTIDFYVLNSSSCTSYPMGSLGHEANLATNTIGNCLNMTKSETSLFLNYSASNRTIVTPYRLYVYGNAQYMSQCPIAVDIS